MTQPPLTNAQLVAFFGEEMFGIEWGAAMSRLTDVNARTILRIKAAAREGRDYPAARGVLAALSQALDHYADQLRQAVAKIDTQPPR